jgi:hypothetical protein
LSDLEEDGGTNVVEFEKMAGNERKLVDGKR